MDNYRFATITFEHDIYRNNYLDTRKRSRNILKRMGYLRVFGDVNNFKKNSKNISYEDWYVHPDLVDMDHVNDIKRKNRVHYKHYEALKLYEDRPEIGKSIDCQDIEYD